MPITNILYVDRSKTHKSRIKFYFKQKRLAARVHTSTYPLALGRLRQIEYELLLLAGSGEQILSLIDKIKGEDNFDIAVISDNEDVRIRVNSLGIPSYAAMPFEQSLERIVVDYKIK